MSHEIQLSLTYVEWLRVLAALHWCMACQGQNSFQHAGARQVREKLMDQLRKEGAAP